MRCCCSSRLADIVRQYFGLNCVDSDVLSNGLKVSTFGVNHAVPAAWMHWASKVVGIEAASRVGDKFVQLLHGFGLF